MTKITDKIAQKLKEDKCHWSFEYFPPKTEQGVLNLYDRLERMYKLGPEFIDVTWNAGGSTSDLTLDICTTSQSVYGLETCMHLTCTNMPREKVDIALKGAKDAGIQNILALRGDPPRGQEHWEAVETGFAHASDLVGYIRQQYGDYFCIGVAGYPEGHLDNPSKDDDIKQLKLKVDCGADFIITQMFYDTNLYLAWLKDCRDIGITIPIIPGIMPIQSYGGFQRMTTLSKTIVPDFIKQGLEPIKDDDAAVKDFGIQLSIQMCNELRAGGVRSFHFCTLNLEKSVRRILEGLEFYVDAEVVKPLPWVPSLAKGRDKETVRPIFWANRTKSYIARTESWDDYPNGRWGDSRSPAYGDLDGYGVSLKYSHDECREMWGAPQSTADIIKLFADYCRGQLKALPWSESPLAPESSRIRDNLTQMNVMGYLTINSQPAVDGAPSADRSVGWGPKNGFCYQKAYLEFFVSPEALDILTARIATDPSITFYAVNRHGDLRTNTKGDGPNALTWGVFPGQEIVQPTVVEAVSFMAWKDEAFELWGRWSNLYDPKSKSAQVITEIHDTWFLMNVVHNNYKVPEAVFDIFHLNVANGHP
ncbi:methylenetetrahydrofolate reductase [NAD(P)H] [Synchytrium microbalum]|uniref:Methylenetetrahydrofolate reductase [NAD(P)H] n=1 Tax=Synchytrium microbalum TaxID=1806994 RepID=A0A507CEL0_9FUNG|nr:methylenetetrahydrofolate reductase [NAD(P)H] [Synchytrium microbalum]TPX35953.1 methylenetetrahydrofolate reductase [NAD(P)H] [Synchytrium microbalum]